MCLCKLHATHNKSHANITDYKTEYLLHNRMHLVFIMLFSVYLFIESSTSRRCPSILFFSFCLASSTRDHRTVSKLQFGTCRFNINSQNPIMMRVTFRGMQKGRFYLFSSVIALCGTLVYTLLIIIISAQNALNSQVAYAQI